MANTTTSKTPPHAAFAARLKSARLRSGKSQEQIAEEVGTSRRHWIRWEGGWILPTSAFMTRIASATGAPVEALSGTAIEEAAPPGEQFRDGSGGDVRERDPAGDTSSRRRGARAGGSDVKDAA